MLHARLILLAAAAALLVPALATAAWILEGNPVSLDPEQAYEPTIVPDGAGGAVIAWSNDRVEGSVVVNSMYAIRIDGSGEIAAGWPAVGVPLYTAHGSQSRPSMVPDGTGGAFVAWDAYGGKASSYDIRVQRVAGSGVIPAWPSEGVLVCGAPNFQVQPVMVSDGAGGVIVAWSDLRDGTSKIFAQRVSASGDPMWIQDGVPLAPAPAYQFNPAIVSDGAGGAFVVWTDSRNYATQSFDLYAQHLLLGGGTAWAPDGVPVSAAGGTQQLPAITADGAGGAYVAWEDARNGVDADIFLQHVRSNGSPATGYPDSGLVVCDRPNDQRRPALEPGTLGEVLVAWHDRRVDPNEADIYAARYGPGGALAPGWNAGGNPICTVRGRQLFPRTCADETSNGAFVVWLDLRNGNADVYVTRTAGDGLVATTISLVSWHADPSAVTLRWFAAGDLGVRAFVQRRGSGAEWREIGEAVQDGPRYLTFVDRFVTAGEVYDYRLRVSSSGADAFGGEVRVTVPIALGLEILSAAASSGSGDLRVRFALDSSAPARLELFDLSGRKCTEREVGSLGRGVHEIDLAHVPRSGLYVVRLVQAGTVRTAKTPVIR